MTERILCEMSDGYLDLEFEKRGQKLMAQVIEQTGTDNFRSTVLPKGHPNFSPYVIGAVLARGFHFIYHVNTWTRAAITDAYGAIDPDQRVDIINLINESCRPSVTLEHPSKHDAGFKSGNYVNLALGPQPYDFANMMLDVLHGQLRLPYLERLVVPSEDKLVYDLLSLSSEGYIAIHNTAQGMDLDFLLPQELDADMVDKLFPEATSKRLIPRAFSGSLASMD